MEYEEFRGIRNDTDLFEYLRDKFQEGVDNYLFIDEVQDIDGFEHVLRKGGKYLYTYKHLNKTKKDISHLKLRIFE